VLSGLVFMVRGSGIAYNEVVVALLDRAGSLTSLRRFAGLLAGLTTALLLLLVATPLSRFWFEGSRHCPRSWQLSPGPVCGWRCRSRC